MNQTQPTQPPFGQGNPFGQGGASSGGDGNVPPPPSPEEQVGVRTMDSDLESIRQSGGESPKTEVVSAPELSAVKKKEETPASPKPPVIEQAPAMPPPAPVPAPPETGAVPETPPVPQPSVEAPTSTPTPEQPATPKKSSFSAKTVLLIVGVVIVAVAVGFGVYYLVTSLNKTPDIPPVSESLDNPLADLEPNASETQEPAVQEEVVEDESFVHTSLIANPDGSQTFALIAPDLNTARGVILSAVANSALDDGQVLDLAFTDTEGVPLSSGDALDIFLPSAAGSLSGLLEKDFTSWLYRDKVGGEKLGMVFSLADGVAVASVSSTVMSVLESSANEIANLFVSDVTAPDNTEFDDGEVEGVDVRFLVYDVSEGNVFEYGWLSVGQDTYLILGTSYRQMVDIITRLTASQL